MVVCTLCMLLMLFVTITKCQTEKKTIFPSALYSMKANFQNTMSLIYVSKCLIYTKPTLIQITPCRRIGQMFVLMYMFYELHPDLLIQYTQALSHLQYSSLLFASALRHVCFMLQYLQGARKPRLAQLWLRQNGPYFANDIIIYDLVVINICKSIVIRSKCVQNGPINNIGSDNGSALNR